MSAVQKFPPAHLISEKDKEGSRSQSGTEYAQTEPLAEGEAQKLDGNAGRDANVAKLDHLGPMVVNTDGTLSRIHNWAEMTEVERERTARVLMKRNNSRLAALEKEEEAKGKAEEAAN